MATGSAKAWQVIINPAAGSGRAARKGRYVFERMAAAGIAFSTVETRAAGQARDLAHTLAASGHRRFLIAGGDGTLNEAVNGLFDGGVLGEAIVAALPLGGGNDWMRNCGLPRHLDSLVSAIKRERLRPCRVGLVRSLDVSAPWQRCFVNAAGIGLDVRVL